MIARAALCPGLPAAVVMPMVRPHRGGPMIWSRPGRPLLLLSLLAALGGAAPLVACPFCTSMGPSLTEAVREADGVVAAVVVQSTLPDARSEGRSEVRITQVIRGPRGWAPGQHLTISRFLATEPGVADPLPYLLFLEFPKSPGTATAPGDAPAPGSAAAPGSAPPAGQPLHAYRTLDLVKPRLAAYLAGAEAIWDQPTAAKLQYFFAYLGDSDPTIATDAYKVFAETPFPEVAAAKAAFDGPQLRRWLGGPRPNYLTGLLACLLGVAGGADDIPLLETLIADRAPGTRGLDGLLGALCLIDPPRGLERVLQILASGSEGFTRRYDALKTVRFLFDEVPSTDRAALVAGMVRALAVPESDLILDELRVRQAWEAAPAIADLLARESARPAAERDRLAWDAGLKFLIACPATAAPPAAADLLTRHAAEVEALKLRLQLEQQAARATPAVR